jgi:hypothetical protein
MGAKKGFYELFSIPAEWKGVVTYANYPFGVPIKDLPPGFTDFYAMVNDKENFAQACAYYVKDPAYFLRMAHAQAWDEKIGLVMKYRFLYTGVFLMKKFTDLPAPGTAIVALRAVDKGDGDGRIEPGEHFSLDLDIVPLFDYPYATHLRCLPQYPEKKVVCAATSEFTPGLTKGKKYAYPGAFDYSLHSTYQGEENRTFILSYYTPQGTLSPIGSDSVPLNEQGYLLGFTAAESNSTGWVKAPEIVKTTSTMKFAGITSFPAPLLAAMGSTTGGPRVYDAATDSVWMSGSYVSDNLLRFTLGNPAAFTLLPIDPEGTLEADEILEIQRNPIDGALWLRTDVADLLRLSVNAAGQAERRVIRPQDLADFYWDGTRDMAIDPWTGRVWLVSSNGILRLSPSGETVELDLGGFSGLTLVTWAPQGGCWIASDSTLMKISANGGVLANEYTDAALMEIISHPVTGHLWGLESGECMYYTMLVYFTPWGTPSSAMPAEASIYSTFHPSTTDGSMFVGDNDYSGAHRYQMWGSPGYTTVLHPVEYYPLGYKPAT